MAWPIAFMLAVTIARSSASLAMVIVAQLILSGLIAVMKVNIQVIFLNTEITNKTREPVCCIQNPHTAFESCEDEPD